MNCEWYESTMNCSNTGLMRIEDHKIFFLNDSLLQYFKTNDKLNHFIHESSKSVPNTPEDLDISKNTILSVINNKLGEFLHLFLFSNNTEAADINDDIISNLKSFTEEIEVIKDNDINVSLFNSLKSKYKEANNQKDMKFVNFGYIKLFNQEEKPPEEEYIFSGSSNEHNKYLFPDMTTLEILFRYYEDKTDGGVKEKFDFVFNDVSQTARKAEFKYKSLYLGKVAHEFKNPIITIIELANNIMESKQCHEKIKDLNLIQSYSNYMLFLAKDMETIIHPLFNQKNTLSLGKINIEELSMFISQVAKCLIKRNNKSKTVNFYSSIKGIGDSFYLITDEIKLKQILINLVSNSIKFTNQGEINLIFEINEKLGKIIITVTDTGVGMNELVIKNIYNPFFKTNKNNPLGMGFGMNIVKELCKLLNTIIQFESIEKIGSKFWLELKLKDENHIVDLDYNEEHNEIQDHDFSKPLQQSAKLLNSPQHHNIGNENESWSSDSNSPKTVRLENFKPTIHRTLQIKQSLSLKHKENNVHHIIVADDEPLIRKSTIRVLKSISKKNNILIEIHEANDGYEVLYLLTARTSKYQKYELIICDENMTYCGGLECQKEINNMIKNDKIPNIPFFILSANFSETSLNDFHISKPLSNDIAKCLLIDL